MNASQQIQALFKQELVLFTQLLEIFQREKETLKKRDTDALQALQQTKQPLITELEQLQINVITILENAGLKNGLGDLDVFISQQTPLDQKELQQLWQEISRMGGKCQKENLTIGGIVELNRLQVATALGILRGTSIRPSEYNTAGRLENNAVSKSLAKA
ncbi:MAG: flagellar protein FlgN [Gammaproteobacteria bacterium]|nr:flagellar protein FlgN [Gammaproteobacteria bacterium]